MKKVIFFDLYQTLLDVQLSIRGERLSREEEVPGWRVLARALSSDRVIDADELRSSYDKRRDEFYAQHDKAIYHHNLLLLLSQSLEEDFDIRLSTEQAIQLLYEFRKATRGYLRLYPKTKATLEKLAERYTLSTASYTQSSYTQLELRELDIEKFFSFFVYTSDVGYRKDSPEFYKRALEIVGENISDCIMVGDNPVRDIIGAQRIGMMTVFAKYGGNQVIGNYAKPSMENSGADYEIAAIEELLQIIESL